VVGPVLVETKPSSGEPEYAAPVIRGLDPKLEDRISILPHSILSGRFDLADHGLVMGTELARQLRVKVGDPLLVYSPADLLEWHRKAAEKGQSPPEPIEYVVRGVFDAGYFKFNSSWIAVSLENAQHLYNLRGSVHGLLVMVKDPSRVEAVQRELARTLGPRFQISNWIEDNAIALGQVIVAKKVQFYLLFFIMLVAALCILSALITFVVQKTREIGMLKALGATDLQVAALFLSQSGSIGAIGTGLGLALGRLALAYRNEFLHFLRWALHSELLAASIYGFSELPARIVPRDLLIICCSAVFVCLLGGVIPAWMASRLKPVEALRHETCG
ncbi:MAG: ABC transporter permease, partial [Candidatus Dormibacteraceae bacterium]